MRTTKYSTLSLAEIEVLMDLTSGRVEDLECDDSEVPHVLRVLAEELEQEHVARSHPCQPQEQEFNGNKIINAHVNCDFPVYLLEVTNKDWDECGNFAVVTDCGWNPAEGFNEFDHRFFDKLEDAAVAFEREVHGLRV